MRPAAVKISEKRLPLKPDLTATALPLFQLENIQFLRNRSFAQEKSGTLQPEILAFIYTQKLFKLFVPENLGGLNAALPQALKLFEQAAFIDGSFGWAVTIGAGGGFFAEYLPPKTAQKLFAPTNAVVAGSGHPTGTATKTDGGYRVSGSWKYCSGANYATIFTASCVVKAPGQPDSIKAFTFLPEQVQVIPDWNTFGLKATGSHSIQIENAFVPEDFTFDLSLPVTEKAGLIFQYPFLQFAQASFATVSLGIARHFLEEVNEIIARKKESWENTDPKRYAFMAKKSAAAKSRLEETSAQFYGIVERSWQTLEEKEEFTEGLLQQITWQCKKTVQVAVHAAQDIFPHLGLEAAKESSVLNQTYRDLHTACQHTLLLDFDEN